MEGLNEGQKKGANMVAQALVQVVICLLLLIFVDVYFLKLVFAVLLGRSILGVFFGIDQWRESSK